MNLEAAANIGEALSGLAIMFTLLFGIRQVMEVNRNRRYEISKRLHNRWKIHCNEALQRLGR